MNTADGLHLALSLKERLLDKGYPIRQVYLFCSVAKGTTHRYSDIDIAVVCDPFLPSKHDENVTFLHTGHEIDVRIETVCLHPEDFRNRYFTLAKEVERHGITV